MRFGMAAWLVLSLGVALAAPAFSSPLVSANVVAPPAATAVPAAALAPALAAETGDYFPPWIIDFSFWVCARILQIFDTVAEVMTEGLKEARRHGDTNHQAPPPSDPTLAEAPLTSPGSPSPRLTP